MQAIPEIKRWSTTRPPPLLTVNSRQLFSHLQLLPSPDSSYRSGKQVGTLSFSSAPPFTSQQLQERVAGRDPLLLFSPSFTRQQLQKQVAGRDPLLLFPQLLPSPDSSYRSRYQVGTLSSFSAPPFTRQQLQKQPQVGTLSSSSAPPFTRQQLQKQLQVGTLSSSSAPPFTRQQLQVGTLSASFLVINFMIMWTYLTVSSCCRLVYRRRHEIIRATGDKACRVLAVSDYLGLTLVQYLFGYVLCSLMLI